MTNKEKQILEFAIENQKRGEFVGFTEVEESLGIDSKIARGVVSSLTKKGLVKVYDDGDYICAVDEKGENL